jgi:hypothetical protein
VDVLEEDQGEVVKVRFIDLCLERSTKTIHCAIY